MKLLIILVYIFCVVTDIAVYSKKYFFNKETSNNLAKNVKRQTNPCGSTLELLNCDLDNPVSLSRREENSFKIRYIPGKKCRIDSTIFDWVLFLENGTDLKFNGYEGRDIFKIRPYWIRTGEHAIHLFVREIHDDSTETEITSNACIFRIRPETPVPQITGGSEITAHSGNNLQINGLRSIDLDVPRSEPGNLQFRWGCTVTGSASDFCTRDLGSGSSITIPASEALDDSTYTVTLSVKTADTDWQSTSQIIHFESDVANIQIKCLKNCPPATQKTNSKEHTILQAECVKYCGGLTKNSYEWSISIPEFDYHTNTKGGKNTDVLHINENVLQVGNKYQVSVSLKDISGGSSVEIDVHAPPKLSSCSISPTSGEAAKTKFSVTCQYLPGHYMFEIHSTQNDIGVVIEKGVRLEDLYFTLGPGSNVKVKIIDGYRFSDEQLLDVTVRSLLETTGSEEDIEKDILSKYFGDSSDISLDKLMDQKDFERAIEVANSLADELETVRKAGNVAITKKFYLAVLKYVDKMPLETGTQARQLGALAAKITEAFSSKPDPEIAALATKLCNKSADKMLKRMKTKRFPDSYSEEIKESASTLSKCSQASAEPNLDVLKPDVALEISTAFPLLTRPVLKEDYPDYVDDQNTSRALSQFDEASRNFVKLCHTNSKKLAITMCTQEETMSLQFQFFGLTSTLRIGRELVGMEIESQRVTLVPSADFSNIRSTVHIAMCTCTKNIFWWIQREEIFTSIAVIGFTANKKPISTFHNPFKLTFGTKTNLLSEIITHEGTTPRIPHGDVPDMEREFEKIAIHRITAYSQQPFVVEFEDLEMDVILDVIVADFHKPTLEELQKGATEINWRKTKLYVSNNKLHDNWYYLAVLPNSKMRRTSAQYKFNVYSLSCFRWAEQEAKWKFACRSTKGSSKWSISCECYHASAIVGMLINNEVREETTAFEEFELEIQASYIILVSLVFAFFLYCVLLAWFSVNTSGEVLGQMIYFLSDVPSACRYGYLIIIKTGDKSKAGTTSNVAIKIYGTTSESKEHVLNYPDPDKKFLQKNQEDWFLIGTEFYLGDIVKLDLWFDSIGYRPAWFCSEVEIFDVQQSKYWLFEVNKWFEILRNDQMVYAAYPVKPEDLKKKKDVALHFLKKIPHSFRGPHMWDLLRCNEQAVSRMKRLHIMFSIFVTTYMLGLYFYGCPRMENSDSLSYTLDYGIDKYVVLITIGCFIVTFAIHFPVVWFFRYPRNDVFGKYQIVLRKYTISTDMLCWCFLIVNIVISMTVLVILGFWVPYVTGLLWLTSIVISLLVYIFIMENFTRLIFNLTMKQQTRVEKIFVYIKSSLGSIEKQRAMLYKKFGDGILRPFFSHLYKPLDHLKIKEQKYWAEIRERLWEILEDLIMITIYVTLLYLVILMDRDVTTYLSNLEVEDLITGTHSRTFHLEDALHRKEVMTYLNDTLIYSMQYLQWYGKYITKNPGMTIDSVNKYLGVARLRQHRTRNTSCAANIVGRPVCRPPFFWHSESRNFSERWMPDILSNKFSRMDTTWDYTDEWHAGSAKYVGTFTIYPGGGYIAALGRTMQNSLINLKYLIRNQWIDGLSRCMFVEFLLYNPSSNLFNSVRIKFEFSTTGYIKQESNVHTAMLLFVKEEAGVMVWIILLSFIVVLTIFIIKMADKLLRKKQLVLKDVWHIVDLLIIVMSLTCLGLYLARSKVVSTFLLRVEKAKNNEFINYFHLMYTERTLTMVAAVLVFLATLRLWKLMRFMLIIKVVEKTLQLSAAPLICLFLYQFVFILACTFYGVLRYGDRSYDFRDVLDTISNLFIVSLNLYKGFNFEILSGTGYIYYSMFMIVMLGFYTLYIAVITICYARAQFYYSSREDYNVVDYVKEQCQYYGELLRVRWRNLRLRGGGKKAVLGLKVYPKANEFRYANCVASPSSKMDAMTSVARCVLRNMKKGRTTKVTDKDEELIKRTIVNLFRASSKDKQFFFISNVRGEKTRLIDDRTMRKMEGVVEALLTRDEERSERERRRKLYRKIVESHEQKMADMADNLNFLLSVLNVNIDV